MKTIFRVGLILIPLLVESCHRPLASQQSIDSEMFASTDCISSCWQGLRPGQAQEEVEGFFVSHFDNFRTFTYDGFVFHTAGFITAYARDNVLVGLSLDSGELFDLTIETTIDTLGEPPYFILSFSMSDITTDLYPFTILYYPQDGYIFIVPLEITSRSTEAIEICIEPTARADRISVVRPSEIAQVILDASYNTIPRLTESDINRQVEALQSWQGYICDTFALMRHPQPVGD